jgi:hypothetical protein
MGIPLEIGWRRGEIVSAGRGRPRWPGLMSIYTHDPNAKAIRLA